MSVGSAWRSKQWLCLALWGVVFGLLPHLVQRVTNGTWVILGTNDDLYYSMIARAPFLSGWSLRDPYANSRELIGVSYAWGLFVPVAKLTALLGGGLGTFLLAWRILGGALLGIGVWLLTSTVLNRAPGALKTMAGPWRIAGLAVVVAATLMVDPGFDHASLPFERFIETCRELFGHRPPQSLPGWYLQFRVISPLCGLGVFFATVALLCRPRLDQRSAVILGLLLGLLFNLYFFYWTAIVGLILALVLVQYSPSRIRRWFGVHQPPRLLLLALVIGTVLGLPQLFSDLSSFGNPVIKEALERTPRGLVLSVHNPARWVYLTGPRLWLDCLLVSLAAFRIRALRVPALLVLISFVLANSAIITALQFENYKWLHALQTLSYFSIWVWALADGGRLLRHHCPNGFPWARRGILLVLVAFGALALVWIPREVLTAREAVERTHRLVDVRALEPLVASLARDASVALPVEAQPVLLHASSGVLYEPAYTTQSFISDEELIQRQVLSAWVLGEDRRRLDLRSDIHPQMFGETRPRWTRVRDNYDKAMRETQHRALDRFRVRYVINRCETAPNPETGNWRALGGAGGWCVWERQLF